jgi:hypothetical protein
MGAAEIVTLSSGTVLKLTRKVKGVRHRFLWIIIL